MFLKLLLAFCGIYEQLGMHGLIFKGSNCYRAIEADIHTFIDSKILILTLKDNFKGLNL